MEVITAFQRARGYSLGNDIVIMIFNYTSSSSKGKEISRKQKRLAGNLCQKITFLYHDDKLK